jgi:hypothetical protein
LSDAHDGLGHRDELLLALRVGEAAPVVHLAQFARRAARTASCSVRGWPGVGDFATSTLPTSSTPVVMSRRVRCLRERDRVRSTRARAFVSRV